jgi:hypothetical protein
MCAPTTRLVWHAALRTERLSKRDKHRIGRGQRSFAGWAGVQAISQPSWIHRVLFVLVRRHWRTLVLKVRPDLPPAPARLCHSADLRASAAARSHYSPVIGETTLRPAVPFVSPLL